MLVDISISRKGWRTVANTWARVRLPRTWPEQLRGASASLRRLFLLERDPVERDPLASLVDTARRLDYGAGRFHDTESLTELADLDLRDR
jgi:hypothetical protein